MVRLNKDYYSIKEASEILNRSIVTIQERIYSKGSNHKINVKNKWSHFYTKRRADKIQTVCRRT